MNTQDDEKENQPPVELAKSVTWDVGVTHKMEFAYNADSTIKEYKTGSSNLAWKYTGAYEYSNKKPVKMIYEGKLSSIYSYANNRVSQKSYVNHSGVETARYTYTYNTQGLITGVKVMVAYYGVLSLSQDISYTYNANGGLTQTHNVWYDEHGAPYATVIRKYESWSPVVYFNPNWLLHSLYQHQANEVFDDVVLSTLNKLPVKITETGNPETGAATYEYRITQTGKRIDKLNCLIKIGNISYNTTEAIFHY